MSEVIGALLKEVHGGWLWELLDLITHLKYLRKCLAQVNLYVCKLLLFDNEYVIKSVTYNRIYLMFYT